MPVLRVMAPGARSIVVDRGFRGGRGQGVPPCGALDPRGLALVNALAGNPPGTEVLEIVLTAPVLRAEGGAVRLALGGLTGAVRCPGHDPRRIGAWQTVTLDEGEELRPDPPPRGAAALIGVAGGLDLPRIMGSRTTCLRAGFGGFHGRALRAGDLLPCAAAPGRPELTLTPPPDTGGPIRAVPGPQADWFDDAALARFFATDWIVTPQADRMGLRLDGPPLGFAPGRGADIISDGIAPGAVQVPGNGLPILLLADAQTTGGYAKIATVIRADLPRLARAMPGDRLRFRAVGVAEAEAAALAEASAIAAAIASLRPVGTGGLHGANLAGAAVDARAPDHFPGHVEGETGCA